MKKRTYVIGAILILLAIIAGDFYLNEIHNYKTGPVNVAGSMPPDIESGATVGNSIQNGTDMYSNTTMATVTNTNDNRPRHIKNDKLYVQANDINEYNGAIVNNGASSMDNMNSDIIVETPKTYYGNTPVTTKRVRTNIPPRNRYSLPRNINLGLELGYDQSSLSHNGTSNIPIGNFNGGLLVNFSFGDHFAIQPGLRYITMGNRLESNMDVETQEKLSLHYLELPANLVWKFGKVGDARIMVGAGPYVSYLVGAKDKFQTPGFSDGADVIPSTPQYNTNNINKFDYGIGGFLGVQSPEGLFAKVGGQVGMMDILKNADGATSNRNYNFMITVGYILGGK